MDNPRERLQKLQKGMGRVGQEMPGVAKAFTEFLGTTVQKEGALTVKTKELILVAMSVYIRCEDCIVIHTYNALKCGATKEEILEAVGVATVFGGGPSFTYIGSILLAALDEFEKDFRK